MSPDLVLVPDPADSSLTASRFVEHFADRAHYAPLGDEASYLNEDTGVAFRFTFTAAGDDEHGPRVAFDLPQGRSRGFALEAARELRALAEALSLGVHDASFASPAAFSEAAFLADFEAAQRARSSALVATGFSPGVRFPRERLAAAHAWNLARAGLQRSLGDEVFVPGVMHGELEGSACTLVVFSDGVPTLIPDFVDQVVVFREELAPMRSMLARDERPALLDRAATLALLAAHGAHDASLRAFRPAYLDVPRELAAAITALPPFEGRLVTFPPHLLVDDDLAAG